MDAVRLEVGLMSRTKGERKMADESIERILEQELGKIGATGGELGLEMAGPIGEMLGVGSPPDAAKDFALRGGLRGASFAARHMKNDVFAATLELSVSPADATRIFVQELNNLGKTLTGDASRTYPVLRAVVMAGLMNMNPAVVEVEVVPLGVASCRITVTGTAKEGLIKQHAGEKAVRRVMESVGIAEAGNT